LDQALINRLQTELTALQGWMRREHADLAAAVADIVAVIATTLKADGAGVWLFDGDDRLVSRAQFPVVEKNMALLGELTQDQYPVYFTALESESYLLHRDVDDAAVLPELADSYFKPAGMISMLDLPVRQSGELIGVVCIDSQTERIWSDDEVQFASSIATLVSLSVEKANRRAADRRLLRQQHELQQVLDSIVEGVITVDAVGRILASNLAAEQILGYDRGELLTVTVKELSPALDATATEAEIIEVIKLAGVDINDATQEQQARCKDGSLIPIRLSLVELPGGPGSGSHYVGSFLDITTEKAQQERLRRSEALESLGHLSGGVAHDFNNMLGVVLGYAELIRNRAKVLNDTDLISKAEKIIHAGRRGSDLTRRLLTFSSRSPGTAKSVDVNHLLETSAELLRKTLTPRIELKLTCQAELWSVFLDPGEFEDAILNLAVNATHAIEQRGTLELRTENCEVMPRRAGELEMTPGDYIRVSVIDDGKGMEGATLARVYEPFFTSRPGEGSGLGLSQVYGFTKGVKGGVFIRSQPGLGTRVELYFPRHDAVSEVDLEMFSTAERPVLKRPGGSVLVIDDESALRQLVETVLIAAGYRVVVAQNGAEGLALALEQTFDLVLSDVIMPVMDGYQLTEALLKKRPTQKITLMTGYEQSATGDHAYAQRVVLRKPFTSAELISVVDKALMGS